MKWNIDWVFGLSVGWLVGWLVGWVFGLLSVYGVYLVCWVCVYYLKPSGIQSQAR